MNATNPEGRTTAELVDAAEKTREALGLRHRPEVIRDEAAAFRIADHAAKPLRVMLGDGAYWVVCPADAERLDRAGFEWAPRPR